MLVNDITGSIIQSAIRVHNELGPGLFESIYEEVLFYELNKKGMFIERQVSIPVIYDNRRMEVGFRADLIVEREVLVEIKSVETISSVHKKQVISYLRLTNLEIGLLINFNEELLKDGKTRLFNNYLK
jgi:GxxExxY protein